MATLHFPVLIWPDAAGGITAALVGDSENAAAHAATVKEALQHLKELLDWRVENDPWNVDPDFIEPGGRARAESFSTYPEGGPFPLLSPNEYACGMAAAFPNEGGAAMLAVDVPDDIVALAVDVYFPLSQGLVQFDQGKGLDELRAAWPTLWKEIRSVVCP